MDVLVSVIVPIYNSSQFLKETVSEIQNQTYSNLEIILVDDGSTDNSLNICNNISENDLRVTVVHKENEGLGFARNTGLQHAHGQYILFIDSDDQIELDMVEEMLTIMLREKVDLVTSNFIYNGVIQDSCIPSRLYDKNEILNNITLKMLGPSQVGKNDQFNVSSCTKMYNHTLIKESGILFHSERELIWEDLAFNYDYLMMCNSVYVLDHAFYHYNYNPQSLTHSYNPLRSKKILDMYAYMKNKVRETYSDAFRKEALERLENNFLGNMRTCIKLEVLLGKSPLQAYHRIKNICVDTRFQDLVQSVKYNRLTLPQIVFSYAVKHNFIILLYFISKMQNLKNHNQIK